MKPIAVFQHAANDGPGVFGEFMATAGRPLRIYRAYAGDALPADMSAFAGLCVLGGAMSVRDPLPHLRREEESIRAAFAAGVPVIGHCLGAQLMSAALGGQVPPAPQAEIGWLPISTLSEMAGSAGFPSGQFHVFQWHSDTFSMPPGATHLAGSDWCAHQAFSLDGIHLGMQFHIEVTHEKVEDWITESSGVAEIAANPVPSVQQPDAIRALTAQHLDRSAAIAHSIYRRWSVALRD